MFSLVVVIWKVVSEFEGLILPCAVGPTPIKRARWASVNCLIGIWASFEGFWVGSDSAQILWARFVFKWPKQIQAGLVRSTMPSPIYLGQIHVTQYKPGQRCMAYIYMSRFFVAYAGF